MRRAESRGRWLFVRALVRLTLLLAATRTIAGAEDGSEPDAAGAGAPASEQVVAAPEAPGDRITVRAVAGKDDDPGPSRMRLTRDGIDARPAALEDPLRALAGSAGISSPSDFRCDLRIRGGESTDTLILLDGLPLPQPYHFSGSPGSAGALDAGLVREVLVQSGGFSAEYGDALAAVVDLTTSDLRPERLTGEGGLSGLQSHVTLRGPAGTGSWVLSGRSGDLSLYKDQVGEGGIQGVSFQDFVGALRFMLPGSARLELTAIGGASGFEQRIGETGRASLRSGDRGERARLEVPIDDRTYLKVLAAHDEFGGRTFSTIGATDNQVERRDDLRISVLRLLSDRHHLGAGISLMRSRDLIGGTVSDGDALLPSSYDREAGTAGIFAEDLWRPSQRLALRYGLRGDRSTVTGGSALSPRLGLDLRMAEGLTLRAAAGRFVQFPRPEQIFMATGEPLKAQVADQIILGLERLWVRGVRLSVEAYGKRIRDPIGESINRYVDLPERLTRFDRGTVRGIDATFERAAPDGWRMRLDYSYLIAREEKDAVWAPSNTDLHHSAAFLLGRSIGRGWEVSGTLRYQSGLPYSPEEPWVDAGVVGIRTLGLNTARLPIYHRLDLRVSRWIPAAWGRLAFYVDLLNVYGRMNVRTVDVYFDPDKHSFYRRLDGQSPFLPVFGLTAEF